MTENIYISIPSADEEFLELTISSAIEKAYDPTRLTFGVFQHCIKKSPVDLSVYGNRMLSSSFYCKHRVNIGFARLSALMLNNIKQDYYFQCDAHMIFMQDWDLNLISSYKQLRKICQKPIISGRTAWWYKSSTGEILFKDSNGSSISSFVDDSKFHNILPMKLESVVALKKHVDNSNEGSLTENKVRALGEGLSVDNKGDVNDFHQHFMTSGNMFFCDFSYMHELMPDPFILFSSDELLHGLRAFSRGYSIYSIPHTIALHQNKFGLLGEDSVRALLDIDLLADKHSYIMTHLDNSDWRKNILHTDSMVNPLLCNLNSHDRVRKILTGEYIGFWGAVDQDGLDTFEKMIDFDFKKYFEED